MQPYCKQRSLWADLSQWVVPGILLLNLPISFPQPTFQWRDYQTNEKLMCQQCHPGTYMAEPCTKERSTVCKPCPENHYTEFWNYLDRCLYCNVFCNSMEEEVRPCNSTHNRECQCKAGYHVKWDFCERHSKCPLGSGVVELGGEFPKPYCRTLDKRRGCTKDDSGSRMSVKKLKIQIFTQSRHRLHGPFRKFPGGQKCYYCLLQQNQPRALQSFKLTNTFPVSSSVMPVASDACKSLCNLKGNPQEDTKCTQCPQGTFSYSASSTEPCHWHQNCSAQGLEVNVPGNQFHDTFCTSCKLGKDHFRDGNSSDALSLGKEACQEAFLDFVPFEIKSARRLQRLKHLVSRSSHTDVNDRKRPDELQVDLHKCLIQLKKTEGREAVFDKLQAALKRMKLPHLQQKIQNRFPLVL